MTARNAPLSPTSVGGRSTSNFQSLSLDKDRIGNPYNPALGGQPPVSPPDSATMNGFPPGPGSQSAGRPSPPPSVARSSGGMYARSESGRSISDSSNEMVLSTHYVALRRYLQQTSKDGRANPPPNRARDKLLRLSPVQFLELSTDVYDELLRRQEMSRNARSARPRTDFPEYLPPEDTFHIKRNQARQKLSTLGPGRFRDLATDVWCELERRFPNFAAGDIPRYDSPASSSNVRGSSRSQLSDGSVPPPRGASRMRRPSDASSLRSGMSRATTDYPPAPSAGFERPQPRQFQSNTIIPNKSTMVEEDDEEATTLQDSENAAHQQMRRPAGATSSETDSRLIQESQAQIRDLQGKLRASEEMLKQKDNDMNRLLEDERSRSTSETANKRAWDEQREELTAQLAEARGLKDTLREELDRMREELDRMREEHALETRQLRQDVDNAKENSRGIGAMESRGAAADSDLQRENEQLRQALQEQEQMTEEVRRETQQLFQEMKELSVQHVPAWEKQAELEKTVEQLEHEVRDWRERYARTKTQLRNMRASSIGLTIDQDVGQYVRDKGFTEENGLVKDVHVTKFQISIDELLQKARSDSPDNVIDAMKLVVVSIRRIIKDISVSMPKDERVMQQYKKLKSRVSTMTNYIITASKDFAAAAGLSPVSLLDAAAGNLVAAVVELLRTVKIRATPTGELEDDDDGTMTPIDSTAFFSNRTTQQDPLPKQSSVDLSSDSVPPRFQGLGFDRNSSQSSAYSPVSSSRGSRQEYNSRPDSRPNGLKPSGRQSTASERKNVSSPPSGYARPQDNRVDDFKIYLEDQAAILVQNVQGLVGSIRGDAAIAKITSEIQSISDVISKVVSETEANGNGGQQVSRLLASRQRLLDAGKHGQDLVSQGLGAGAREWRMWTNTLPPIAFEIARENRELVQRMHRMTGDADDFS